MHDPDAPVGGWDHWVIFNIPPDMSLGEGKAPEDAIHGENSWGHNKHGGPCPPSGIHHYVFRAFALDTTQGLLQEATSVDMEEALEGHVLAIAKLVGLCTAGRGG